MCKRHRLPDPCWRCQRGQAICKSKIRFWTWFEAEEWAKEYNETHGYIKPLAKYKCRWCPYWHIFTVKRRHRHLRKEKRRWMIAREVEKREHALSP